LDAFLVYKLQDCGFSRTFGTTRGTKKKHPEVDAFLVYKLQDCGFSRIFGTTRGTKKKHPEEDAFFSLKIARLWVLPNVRDHPRYKEKAS
jgi:hypothetical protein